MKPKILVSLVTASISALALAPELSKEINGQQQDDIESNQDNKFINAQDILSSLDNPDLKEYQEQMAVLVNKKSPLTKLGDNVIIMAENYNINESETFKKHVLEKTLKESLEEVRKNLNDDQKELLFALSDSTWLSTWTTPSAATTSTAIASETSMVCHGTCHIACHGACHGARGWR